MRSHRWPGWTRSSRAFFPAALLLAPIAVFAQTSQPPIESFPAAARAAIADAQREASARPGDADAVGRLGMVLHAWEQWNAADAAYRRAQQLAPAAFDWLYLDAVVAMRTGRAADAVVLLTRALPLSSSSAAAARMKLAEALLDAGDLARSGEQYRALAQIPATEPAAQYGLGRIASAQQKWADAVPHLRRACELFPEYGAAHYALGLALRNLGQLDDAQRELALHRQYGPRWPALDDPTLAKVAALKDDGHAHLERGIRLGTDGKLEDAITEHELALVRDPALAQAHANLITLYGRLGNVTKAEEHYEAVVAMKSNLDEAHYNYGVVLALAQRDTEAAEALRQAIAVNPSHAQAHNTLGALLERERRWDAAADEYRQAVTSQPALRLARFNLGRMLIVQQRYDEAIAELGRVIDPDDAESPRYVYALATAYLRAGQREPGMKYAAEARRRALAHDQAPLAAAIEKELASLQAPR